MKPKKKDLMILLIDEDTYYITQRKPFLYIFKIWQILMYVEADGNEELPIEFKTKKEAEDFIEQISQD
jgi:hypothetical protein